jgi:hypothetical protein
MASLNVLALIIGIIAILARLPGIVWPDKAKEFGLKFLDSDTAVKTAGIVAFTLGLLIIFVFLKNKTWLEIVLFMLAVLWLPCGVLIFYRPDDYRELAKRIMGETLLRIRILSGIGCAIGLLLVLLALFG